MTTTLVISDLHLDPEHPEAYARVRTLLARESFDQLWILGDLFEAWVGDDGADAPDLALADFFRTQPYPIFWIPGNRDFLVGEHFRQTCGWNELTPIQRLNCGLTVLVRHGDEWCTEDRTYQAFRQDVRSSTWQATFLAQPLSHRRKIAKQMRQESQRSQAAASATILDVSEQAIEIEALACGAQLVVHGHTHRPQLHRLAHYVRAVTSDWHESVTVLRLIDTADACRVEQVLCHADLHSIQATATWRLGAPEWNLN
ncbi:MAG: UDP-2,3-diacylglucosamine diphosphatase [Gammaproteobacteria bacterium]|nr:UDP-2,3-diacylglucosamine diphosphatase [Gammaproteobacteria bacterium]